MNKWHIGVLMFASMLPVSALAACVPLAETMSIGVKHDEVRLLQQFLNANASTTVAYVGSGSQGNETNYFGPATSLAVKKFQTLHFSEVLTPAGLTRPSGIVGKFTRDAINRERCALLDAGQVGSSAKPATAKAAQETFAKEVALRTAALMERINALKAKAGTTIVMPTSSQSSLTGTTPGSPVVVPTTAAGGASDLPLQIFTLEPYLAKIGDRVTIKGTGITKGTVARIGGITYPLTILEEGSAATLDIGANIPLAKYYVTLENGAKKSNDRILIVVADTTKIPVLSGMSPDTGNVGTTITLTGQNFAPKNDIITSIGTIYDVSSSDGKTLTFPVTADSKYFDNKGRIMQYLTYFIAVANQYGISEFKEFKIR